MKSKNKKSNKEKFWANSQNYLWVGIAIILLTLGVLHVYYTPSDKEEIILTHKSCTATIGILGQEINIGSHAQKLLGSEDVCRNAYYHSLVLKYGWIGYVLGILLILVSFLLMKKDSIKRLK